MYIMCRSIRQTDKDMYTVANWGTEFQGEFAADNHSFPHLSVQFEGSWGVNSRIRSVCLRQKYFFECSPRK